MNDEARRAELEAAYRAVRRRFMAILYREDPEGMGSKASAPADEYAEEAARLMALLRGAATEHAVAQRVREMFPGASARLVRDIHRAWTEGGGPDW